MSLAGLSTKLCNQLTLYIDKLTHGHDLGIISLFGCYVKVTGGQRLLGKKSYSVSLQNRFIFFIYKTLRIHQLSTKECLHQLCLLERFSLIDTLPLLRPVPIRRWMNKRHKNVKCLDRNPSYWPWQKKFATQKNKFAKKSIDRKLKVFGRTALTKYK